MHPKPGRREIEYAVLLSFRLAITHIGESDMKLKLYVLIFFQLNTLSSFITSFYLKLQWFQKI